MTIRKISLGRRCMTTLLVLMFGVFAPIGCAQTPKNLFSKVWGPDRIKFKEVVGLGDSQSKKKKNPLFAGKLANKSVTKRSSKLAENESKTIGQKIGNFGKVLITGFKRTDKDEEAVKKTAAALPPTQARIENARKRLASNSKSNGNPALRNLGKTSASETLRKNRIRNSLKTKKSPSRSLSAANSTRKQDGLDKSRTNPFSEFLDTQNPSQSRPSVKSVNTRTPGNTLAQNENPFLNSPKQSNQKLVIKPQQRSTGSPNSNQFVAEFDNSWDNIRREQEQFVDDDDDELDELGEMDEIGGINGTERLASSRVGNSLPVETGTKPETNLNRREQNRKHVDRLMLSAHSELAKGRTVDALNFAQTAEKLAANEGVFFGPKEEQPRELVRSIRAKLNSTLSQSENVPPADPVIIPRNRTETVQGVGIPSQDSENTNPFAELNPSEKRFAALPQPPENAASVAKNESLPDLENFNDEAFEPQIEKISPSSHAEVQTVIVEMSDPFDGMIVESESVPRRIPAQDQQEKTDTRPIVRSADARTTKFRGPKTISQKVLNRLKSSSSRSAIVDKKQAVRVQEPQAQSQKKIIPSKPRKKNPKRINSNRGARIITTRHQVPMKSDNAWHAVETKKQNQVETAQLTIEVAKQTEEKPLKVASSEQPVNATSDGFFQMGGSSDEKTSEAKGLPAWDKDPNHNASSSISELQERFLIIVCFVIAGLIGFGIHRRYSLQLLLKKFAAR